MFSQSYNQISLFVSLHTYMASLSLLLVGFLVLLAANEVLSSNNGGEIAMDMEEDELFGLFEVMGSLLEDPSWAQMHPQPCTYTPWPGIECELLLETSIFHVTKIHLGPDILIPPCKSSAKIPQSLQKLPYLKTLSLINCFTNSLVALNSPVFANLSSNFEHLALDSNPTLSGEIPSGLSNLENLKILCLSQNNLSGEIPKEIGKLVNLQQLDLNHNKLTGPIPQEIGNLKNLAILDLSWNSLQKTLPFSLSGLQFLEKIDLGSNKLEGTLPEELGNLKRLVLLDLGHNLFTGPISENFSNLEQLQYLIMEGNPLNTGIPTFTGSLLSIKELSFSGCGLTGPIRPIFSKLTNLAALSLDNNSLNGAVPQELGKLPKLDFLNLSRNQLSGEVLFPQEFISRLGFRLDIGENNGLCVNQGEEMKKLSSRFLEIGTCSSSAKVAGDGNKTLAENHMKPTLYGDGISSSCCWCLDQNLVLLLGPIFLLLLFGS